MKRKGKLKNWWKDKEINKKFRTGFKIFTYLILILTFGLGLLAAPILTGYHRYHSNEIIQADIEDIPLTTDGYWTTYYRLEVNSLVQFTIDVLETNPIVRLYLIDYNEIDIYLNGTLIVDDWEDTSLVMYNNHKEDEFSIPERSDWYLLLINNGATNVTVDFEYRIYTQKQLAYITIFENLDSLSKHFLAPVIALVSIFYGLKKIDDFLTKKLIKDKDDGSDNTTTNNP